MELAYVYEKFICRCSSSDTARTKREGTIFRIIGPNVDDHDMAQIVSRFNTAISSSASLSFHHRNLFGTSYTVIA